MIRLAALFAIIAFVVTSTGMASARPMRMGMDAMPMMAHVPGAPELPCGNAAGASCDICCVVAPTPAPIVPSTLSIRPTFAVARVAVQTGLAVPPALPPPRSADPKN